MRVHISLALGLAAAALLVGVSFGYYLTPEYERSMYVKDDMGLGAADRTFDLRYVNAMISHHRGAMLLAEQLTQNTARPELQQLASAILADEPAAIAELYAWKKDWYDDTRAVRDPAVANLGAAGDTFDLRFLNAMVAHHEAGVVMAREARTKSSRAEILNNADAVEAFLTAGVSKLRELRLSWYGI